MQKYPPLQQKGKHIKRNGGKLSDTLANKFRVVYRSNKKKKHPNILPSVCFLFKRHLKNVRVCIEMFQYTGNEKIADSNIFSPVVVSLLLLLLLSFISKKKERL